MLWLVAFLLAVPAFLLNLGILPLVNDEGIRALIAYEMILSDNYVTPTINGEFYYNKPPMWNWILVLIFKAAGSYEEVLIRYPVVFSLAAYSFSIFLIVRKFLPGHVAVFTAFAFLTNGAILFDNSNMGLIDIFYSWLTWLSFMIIYYFYRKKKLYPLFLLSYSIAALGILLKGLPSLAFQGITLLSVFIYSRDFKRIFSLPHIAGGFMFLLIIGAYFFLYDQYNDFSRYIPVLWDQSSQKTFLDFSFWKLIVHVLKFPLELIYNFLPWSFLLVFCFRRDFMRIVFKHPFLKFNLIVFLANIVIYWLSPALMQRYLFMLYPMAFTIIFYFYFEFRDERKGLEKIVENIYLGLIVLAFCVSMLLPFIPYTSAVDNIVLKGILTATGILLLLVAYMKIKSHRLIVFILVLFVVRIGFNFTVVERQAVKSETRRPLYKKYGQEIGRMTQGEELKIIEGTLINSEISYYISREREEILEKDFISPGRKFHLLKRGIYYIVDEARIQALKDFGYQVSEFYEFDTRDGHTELKLIKLD